jgi:hypothetical protein
MTKNLVVQTTGNKRAGVGYRLFCFLSIKKANQDKLLIGGMIAGKNAIFKPLAVDL